MNARTRTIAVVCLAFLFGAATAAQPPAGMPDPRRMSGIPLPVGDLDPGTVSVRLVRESLDRPIADQAVALITGGRTLTATTNAAGRVEFAGLTPGAPTKAVVTIDGERLVSQEFPVPTTGGVRLMLVASDPAGRGGSRPSATAAGSAQPGTVVLGSQSRFVVEIGDEALSVFNLLEIRNSGPEPVQPAVPVVFELPDGAAEPGMLEGSSPQARLEGRSVVVTGPFAPGATIVQFAYSMPYAGGDLTFEQRMPVALAQFNLLAQKAGSLRLTSPQIAQQREMSAEGRTYIVGQGPGVAAGEPITLAFTSLPHAATWPRNLALALAAAILAAGAWASTRGAAGVALQARQKRLQDRRERLFTELASLEDRHREGRIEADAYAAARRDLVAALERVYAELDDEAAA